MSPEHDPDWPGLSEKDDVGGSGYPELNRTEIKRIAGDLRKALEPLITATAPPARAVAFAKGDTPPPLPGPPAGAGSLPDLRLQCAISDEHLGKWQAAQNFASTMGTAYGLLIGEGAIKRDGDRRGSPGGDRLQAGSGAYADVVMRADAMAETLLEMVESFDKAEQANGAHVPREV
ncbi:hypothetical protein [Microtetraspora sp. NBRC 16547]|uniref:hypothetical protein n=1 Tax=Microtetraspora sp. NBRC 16547 TaxID=3030993 RepID=UPI0024A22537|nr:hypothetical protein [Microtetraspora sp. NBRC 16547]GLW96144.1 hypothetical protein Misp02_02310 [Microtetraspora sp. NBRC 16547]